MRDKYTNLSMEHQQHKCQESTAPFQVYFQTPREGRKKVCKVILNITYIYDPAGRLDILWAFSNGPDLRQDTLVCALEPHSLSYLVSSHHWFRERNSCMETLTCSNLEKILFSKNCLIFLFKIFLLKSMLLRDYSLQKTCWMVSLPKK